MSPAPNTKHLSYKPDTNVDWRMSGNCWGIDPNIFFPERGGSNKLAKAICKDCSVRIACLDYAIKTNQQQGIWGGQTVGDVATIS